MLPRSIDKHNMRYTVYVGDGDKFVRRCKNAVEAKFGDTTYPIEKEGFIGHFQKRMGAALRAYKNNIHGKILADLKGACGTGRLTDGVIDRIQTYYAYSIRNNKGDTATIIQAIRVIYYVLAGPA